jgi:hypothetical protein
LKYRVLASYFRDRASCIRDLASLFRVLDEDVDSDSTKRRWPHRITVQYDLSL